MTINHDLQDYFPESHRNNGKPRCQNVNYKTGNQCGNIAKDSTGFCNHHVKRRGIGKGLVSGKRSMKYPKQFGKVLTEVETGDTWQDASQLMKWEQALLEMTMEQWAVADEDEQGELQGKVSELLKQRMTHMKTYHDILRNETNTFDAIQVRTLIIELMNMLSMAFEHDENSSNILQRVLIAYSSRHNIGYDKN